jgi:hypothetical protein
LAPSSCLFKAGRSTLINFFHGFDVRSVDLRQIVNYSIMATSGTEFRRFT